MIPTYVTYQMVRSIFTFKLGYILQMALVVSDMIMSLMIIFLFIMSDHKSIEPESIRNASAYTYKKFCSVFLPVNYSEKDALCP